MSNTQTIGVIGAKTIGHGIAQMCVLAGLSVVMLDVDEGWLARLLKSHITHALSRRCQRR